MAKKESVADRLKNLMECKCQRNQSFRVQRERERERECKRERERERECEREQSDLLSVKSNFNVVQGLQNEVINWTFVIQSRLLMSVGLRTCAI